MSSLPSKPQPDAQPTSVHATHPSLWLYVALLLLALGLIYAAFSLQIKPDWPGLLLNLGAGLVGSVVILIFVDRRLRAGELAALRRLPSSRTTRTFASLIFPTIRISQRYSRHLLVVLEPLTDMKVRLAQFDDLESKARAGFVLRADPGQGKTTWTQTAAVSLARQYLDGSPDGRIPIVFPLARWMSDRTLDQALFENVTSYAPCGRWVFDRLLKSGPIVVLLDGYDELWKRRLPLESEVERLRSKYPGVAWTPTSRTAYPNPQHFGEVVTLSKPSDDELAVITNRHK